MHSVPKGVDTGWALVGRSLLGTDEQSRLWDLNRHDDHASHSKKIQPLCSGGTQYKRTSCDVEGLGRSRLKTVSLVPANTQLAVRSATSALVAVGEVRLSTAKGQEHSKVDGFRGDCRAYHPT